jgi:hypothetical protein
VNLSIERLGQGERIAAGSALALFACMFLSWFNFSYTASNAWESLHYTSPILAISIVATLGIAFAEVREFDIGDIPGGLVVFVLGCVSALLILFRLIDPISTPGIESGSTSGSVEAGAFLGFFAALGIAAGGYVTTDGKAVDRLKALLPNGSGTSGAFPAPPPPAPAQPPASAPTPPVPSAAPTAVTPPRPPSPLVPPPAPEPPAAGAGDAAQPAAPGPSSEPAPEPSAASPGSTEASSPPAVPEDTSPPEAAPLAEPKAPAVPVVESAEEGPRSVFCEGCGSPLRTADRFCRKCGHEQAQVAAAES